jgi:putative ABC transport system permease protein
LLAIETAYKPWLATFFILGCCGAIAVLYGTSYGAQAVMRWLDKALKKSRVPAVVRLAINNIHRPGAPTPAIILSLGLGLTVLVSVTQIDINLRNQLAERVPQKAPTFFFIDIQSNQIDDFRHRAQAIPGVSLLSEAAMIRGRIVKANGHPVSETTVPENIRWAVRGDRGFTEAAQQPENATLTAGTWWDADYTGAPLVSLDQNIARGLGLGVGDTITVNILGQDVTAKIANLRAINWMSMSMNFTFVFNKGGLGALPRTYIVTAKAEGTAKPALERSIAEAMPNISAIPVADALKTAEDMINTGSNAVALAALVAVISGVCVLVGAMAIGQDKRIKEAITLKVLGATPAMLWRIYILEFSVLGGLVAGIALGLGSLAAWAVITHVMHLPFHLAIVPALAVLALGLTITIALGFLGSYQALRSKPASLLKNDA